MKRKPKIILRLLLAAILLFCGFLIGRKVTPVKIVEKIEYKDAEPIHDTVDRPVPVEVQKPIDVKNIIAQAVKDGVYQELFPEKIVEVEKPILMTSEDTLKIVIDWATKREYNEVLFDNDTLGTFKLKTSVQYNRLGDLIYDFQPKQKVVTKTVYTQRKYIPYIGAGVSTFPAASAEFGMFFNQSWGLAIDSHYYPRNNLYDYIPRFDVGLKAVKVF